MNKDGELKYIKLEDISNYKQNGWKLGFNKCSLKGTIWIYKNGKKSKMIYLSEFKKYKNNGWKKGTGISTTKGKNV